MAIAKGFGGYIFHSSSLVADGVHALSDILSDFLTLGTVSVATRAPDKKFPRGYGKIESLGATGVAGMLIIAGFGTGISSVEVIVNSFGGIDFIDLGFLGFGGHGGHSHSHGHFEGLPDVNAAWLAAGSIVVKEWLYQATMRVAKSTKSTVLVANAWHHRVDCLTSVVALVAISGSHLFDVAWLDPAAGVLVSAVVLRAGYSAGKQAVIELADHIAPVEIQEEVEAAIDRAVTVLPVNQNTSATSSVELYKVTTLKAGPIITVDVVLKNVSDDYAEKMLLQEANEIVSEIKVSIRENNWRVGSVTWDYLDAAPVKDKSSQDHESHHHS